MKEKLLFVNDKMEIGGNSVALISLLDAIDKDKYEIDLLLYKNQGDLLSEIPAGVHLLPQAARFQSRFGFIFRLCLLFVTGYGFRALLTNARNHTRGLSKQIMWDFQAYVLSRHVDCKYDYAVSFFEGWADRYVSQKVCARKKIGWLHSMFRKIAPIPHLENRWMRDIDNIVCVSEESKADFVKQMPEFAKKVIVIENVRNSTQIRRLAATKPMSDKVYQRFSNANGLKIITVCRLSIETKGLDRAVNCASKLKESGYSFCWCVVGNGEDREMLQSMIAEKNVSDCFILAGSRLNPYPFLKCSDVMCLPSRWEGKPLAVYESMILTVPQVVTEYASAHEQIKNKLEGIVVQNNDFSIEPALASVMDNPDLLNKMKHYLSEHEYGDLTPVDKIGELLHS